MNGEKSTFIRVDRFESVMSALSAIKRKIAEAKATLGRINELKQEEDAAAQKWSNDLNSVQARVENIGTELDNEGQ